MYFKTMDRINFIKNSNKYYSISKCEVNMYYGINQIQYLNINNVIKTNFLKWKLKNGILILVKSTKK